MKKAITLISFLFLFACNKGIWVTKNAYRPKHQKFSIPKEPFKANELIDNHSLYISKKKFTNYDGNVLIGYMGFFFDGRMIVDNSWEKEMNQTLNERCSFKTASSIGYYTTKGNTLIIEYFLPGDGGLYLKREGILKKDTVILIDKFPQPLNKDIRLDTLIKSLYPLKDN